MNKIVKESFMSARRISTAASACLRLFNWPHRDSSLLFTLSSPLELHCCPTIMTTTIYQLEERFILPGEWVKSNHVNCPMGKLQCHHEMSSKSNNMEILILHPQLSMMVQFSIAAVSFKKILNIPMLMFLSCSAYSSDYDGWSETMEKMRWNESNYTQRKTLGLLRANNIVYRTRLSCY